MLARNNHRRMATFIAKVSQSRSGGWSTQCKVAARFLHCKRAPSHLQQGGSSVRLTPRLLWEGSVKNSSVISARLQELEAFAYMAEFPFPWIP